MADTTIEEKILRLQKKKLSKAQALFLKALLDGENIQVSPPIHSSWTPPYKWSTFVALNTRGYVWACPHKDERPQTEPGYMYYGGKGCFHQNVRLTNLGRERI